MPNIYLYLYRYMQNIGENWAILLFCLLVIWVYLLLFIIITIIVNTLSASIRNKRINNLLLFFVHQ